MSNAQVTTTQTNNGAITVATDVAKAMQQQAMKDVEARRPAKTPAPKVVKTGPANSKGKGKDAGAAAFAALGGQVKATLVTVGGSAAEPERVDAAAVAAVTFNELSLSGSVLQNLAFNFLAGTVDGSVTVESLKDLPRALRNEKGAITKLLGQKAVDIRAKWEALQATRKRCDKPSLRVMAGMFSTKAKDATTTWQEKVGEILEGKQSDKMKLQMLAELVAPAK